LGQIAVVANAIFRQLVFAGAGDEDTAFPFLTAVCLPNFIASYFIAMTIAGWCCVYCSKLLPVSIAWNAGVHAI